MAIINIKFIIVGALGIRLTDEEKSYYGQLFRQADPQSTQNVSGAVASTLFMKSGLSPFVLSEIWQLADPKNQGFLDQEGFSLALRLIGHIQNGQALTSNLGDTRTSVVFFSINSISYTLITNITVLFQRDLYPNLTEFRYRRNLNLRLRLIHSPL